MGQYLNQIDADTKQALKRAEDELAGLTGSKEWQAAKLTADITGIGDPTPASDGISLSMSVAEGDWLGAFLSGVSFIPYAGDAFAKPMKMARATKTIAKIESKAAALAKQVAHYKSQAKPIARRKVAAAKERARRAKEAATRYVDDLKCGHCKKSGNTFGTQTPATGRWGPNGGGAKGNSRWTSDDGSVSLDYKEGYPDFSTSKPPSLHTDGGGKVEIAMEGNSKDFTAARNAMREKIDDPKWPGVKGKKAPNGYTWHHKEDGTTMELVRTDVHDKAVSGAAHTGGASIVSGKDSEF